MQVIVDIPGALLPDTVDAFKWKFNYKSKILNENGQTIDNPETEADFAKRMLIKMVRDILIDYRRYQFMLGKSAAVSAAESEAETITQVG
jgi:hypothetical protein